MATWIAHLRVAERLLGKYPFDKEAFLVGNIGPDSGVPNEDWSAFDPPKKITHWLNEDKKIDAEGFWNTYIREGCFRNDNKRFSFLVGYYIHLISDIEWSDMHNRFKITKGYKEQLEKDPSYIWTIKKDWYGLDFLYLQEYPNSVFFTDFININYAPDYLDYFSTGAFIKQVNYIQKYYTEEKPNLDREFVFLTKSEMNEYINKTINIIEEHIENKNMFCL